MTSLGDEARALAAARARQLAALSWEALDAYGEREERVALPSGPSVRVRSYAFWDMKEWASGLYVVVKVYPERGWRRRWPYKAIATRGGPDDPVPPRPGGAADPAAER